jgi:serine phosphatase RsbU (regulator of sigma subunit)
MRTFESLAHVQQQIELASAVQRSMLPSTLPEVPGYSFWAHWEPAIGIGGDMYAFHVLPTNEILVLVADVAGKGIAAALGMACLAGMIPLIAEKSGADLPRFVADLNRSVFRSMSPVDRMTTLLAMLLDPTANRVRIVNAGHLPAVVRRRNGNVRSSFGAAQVGLPLGVVEQFRYQAVTLELAAEDAVVLFSDGITKAVNVSGNEYGISRVNDLLARDQYVGNIGATLLDDVKGFASGVGFKDDVVVVAVSREI